MRPKADKFACGEFIDSGCSRKVYVSARNPRRVVKVLNASWSEDNKREAEIWRAAGTELRRYLARVYAISEDGTKLLMERTEPVPRTELRHFLIPDVINHDAHEGNFGRVRDGRIVMHDYAFTLGTPKGTGRSFSHPEYVE